MKLFVELRVEEVDSIRKKSIDDTVDSLTLLLRPDEDAEDELKAHFPVWLRRVLLAPVDGYVTHLLRAVYSAEITEPESQEIGFTPIDNNETIDTILAGFKEHLQEVSSGPYVYDVDLWDNAPILNKLGARLDDRYVEMVYDSLETTLQEIRDEVYLEIAKQIQSIRIQFYNV